MIGGAHRALAWAYLGRVPYRSSVGLQESIRARVQSGASTDRLLLLEHPHVYTLGRSASRNDLLLRQSALAQKGVEVHETDRGGQVTYHGPGQLVGYPILNLNPDRRDVRRYVQALQQVLVDTLARFGIEARARHKQPEIGVWVGKRKIASIGVHLSRWITTHGFALNVSTDLEYFDGIVPCGLPDVRMTSIAREAVAEPDAAPTPQVSEVAEVCAEVFADVFGYHSVERERVDFAR